MATAHRTTGGGQNKSDKVLTPAEAYEDFFTIPCPPDAKTCSELQAELGKSRNQMDGLIARARELGRLQTFKKAFIDNAGHRQVKNAYRFLKKENK